VRNYAAREDKSFRVLWSSAPFNDLALMASPRVPAADVHAVAQGLPRHAPGSGGPPHPRRRRRTGALAAAARLRAAGDADYASYRAFYAGAPINLR
jgi:phosphonate transport system substrate-binding protein